MNDLSEAMGVANSTMTRTVEQLVQKGFVDRESDSEDRRIVRGHMNQFNPIEKQHSVGVVVVTGPRWNSLNRC